VTPAETRSVIRTLEQLLDSIDAGDLEERSSRPGCATSGCRSAEPLTSRLMGIAADLGYQHRSPNPFQRAIQAGAGTPAGSWAFSKSLRHLDDVVSRLSKGQRSAPGVLAGLPVLDLTTVGRTSGQKRTTHLISIPIADTLALLGTNFGQPETPAWVLNLEANPRAEVCYRGTTLGVSRS
jgi:hypothetical protein